MLRYEKALMLLLGATVRRDARECLELLPLSPQEWTNLMDLAGQHGTSSLVLSAVEMLPAQFRPSMDLLMDMVAQAESLKVNYKSQFSIAARYAAALQREGVIMSVLKGISFSTYYDKPYLRECGDCDCWLSLERLTHETAGASGFERGNDVAVSLGGRYEKGTSKHSHLFIGGLMFENHQYLTDFNNTTRGRRSERLLEAIIEGCHPARLHTETSGPSDSAILRPETIGNPSDAARYRKETVPGTDEPRNFAGAYCSTPIGNTAMIRPCAHFNALFLIRHAYSNFFSWGLTLRMLYDWAVFLRAEQNNLDWAQFYADCDVCGTRVFAEIMTDFCVKYLGVKITCDDVVVSKDDTRLLRVVKDTFTPKLTMEIGESFFHKVRRILARFARMWRFRDISCESFPVMVWNSFVFSSYFKGRLSL